MNPRIKAEPAINGNHNDTSAGSHGQMPIEIGANLRQLRKQQGHSLDALAQLSGVSRAMLGQIETGKSIPTVTLLWKIAGALRVPVATLIECPSTPKNVRLPRSTGRLLSRSDGRFTLRTFSAPEFEMNAGFHELQIAPGHRECAGADGAGARGSLVVTTGQIEISFDGSGPTTLNVGDAILFEADIEQTYFNPGAVDAVAYLVITPGRRSGQSR